MHVFVLLIATTLNDDWFDIFSHSGDCHESCAYSWFLNKWPLICNRCVIFSTSSNVSLQELGEKSTNNHPF